MVIFVPRVKLQPAVSDILQGLGLPRDWVHAGRPCAPRVLFAFQTHPLGNGGGDSDAGGSGKNRGQVVYTAVPLFYKPVF